MCHTRALARFSLLRHPVDAPDGRREPAKASFGRSTDEADDALVLRRGVKSGCGNAWEDVGRRGHPGEIVAARLPRLCRTPRHLPGQGRRHLAPAAVQGNGSLRRIACQSCTGRGPFSYTCEFSVDRQKRACARVRFKKVLYCTLSQKSCGGEFGKKGQKWNIKNHL